MKNNPPMKRLLDLLTQKIKNLIRRKRNNQSYSGKFRKYSSNRDYQESDSSSRKPKYDSNRKSRYQKDSFYRKTQYNSDHSSKSKDITYYNCNKYGHIKTNSPFLKGKEVTHKVAGWDESESDSDIESQTRCLMARNNYYDFEKTTIIACKI